MQNLVYNVFDWILRNLYMCSIMNSLLQLKSASHPDLPHTVYGERSGYEVGHPIQCVCDLCTYSRPGLMRFLLSFSIAWIGNQRSLSERYELKLLRITRKDGQSSAVMGNVVVAV